MGFEVVNFVATTRRWYDRGNPRDAGDATPAKVHLKGSGFNPTPFPNLRGGKGNAGTTD
ncbi:MAG: hypothetical protein [Chaetfec virus UA24_244]|nr:MAG: hypothetical protein [Chaetfec virus UA24_244]